MENGEMSYTNLPYGSYIFTYDAGSFEENVKYTTAPFNKLYTRRIRLPDGKGNVVYLMSDTFDHSLDFIKANGVIVPPNYMTLYYPAMSMGQFMGRRYRLNVKSLKKERIAAIRSKVRLRPYAGVALSNKNIENIVFTASDIIDAVQPVISKYTVRRLYEDFFKEFIGILNKHTPPKSDKNANNPNWNNRIILIDADRFRFNVSAPLNENKNNPLFLLYLAFLRNKNLSKLGVDMDILICSKNLFIKINPAKTVATDIAPFKRSLFRIMNANLDAYADALHPDEKKELDITPEDETVSGAINKAIEPYTAMVSPSTKAVIAGKVEEKIRQKASEVADVNDAIKTAQRDVAKEIGKEDPNEFLKSLDHKKQPSIMHTNPVTDPLSARRSALFKSIGSGYERLAAPSGQFLTDEEEDYEDIHDYEDIDEDEIEADATEILTSDEELMEDIVDITQDNVAPLTSHRNSPVTSARDEKLREQQKKVVVKNSTIEEVLAKESTNVPVPTEDKSKALHTSNPNVQKITFGNFNKTYLDKLFVKDIVAAFDQLKDKELPFYVTSIDVKDTSTALTLKETWTVGLVDGNGKKTTIKIDIPKFQNDRFMMIEGTRRIIWNQNLYNPIVKDSPDEVIITTNYNKVTLSRKATRSLGVVERIFTLIKKSGDTKMFVGGDSGQTNKRYLSTLEYDELSRRLFQFKSPKCTLCFSREYIQHHMASKIPGDIKGDEFYIGQDHGQPVFINEDTGLDRQGRTIAEIIEANLPDEYKAIYHAAKAPAATMYASAKVANQDISVIGVLCVWIGITEALNLGGIEWRFLQDVQRLPHDTSAAKYIRFSDGVLEYKPTIYAELLLNGLKKMSPEKYRFEDFDSEDGYGDYIKSIFGTYRGISELMMFYEFLIDPITKDVCKDLMLPDTAPGLMIHATKLLADNACVSKASDKSYRVRSIEIIPAILYNLIADQYKAHVQKGLPMTLEQNKLIQELLKIKTVETYSTLNPVSEITKTHSITTKGYKGSNSSFAYNNEEKRSYDPSAMGKIAISTSADANVGVNKNLVVEPTITNARGYREPIEGPEELKDINVFSPAELLTPGTSRNDDPIRTAIACKQSSHVVPVKDAAPSLISNGFDEAVQFHLSDDFVINAEEDGKVIDVNEELGFIMVEYKSGKTRAISMNPEIVQNTNSAFYLSNQLTPTHTKVGERFKKDEPLAYHDKYFKYSKLSGLRYAMGPIAKIAFMSSYNTYEDAGICTKKLADRMKMSVVYQQTGRFTRNNNILSMVKIGDHVNVGDVLIKYDKASEDDELSRYLSKLPDSSAALLEEETKNDIKADHPGKIIDIKVFSLLEPSALSPSLASIVKGYFDKSKSKKAYLSKFDDSDGIIKAGYMVTDSTEPEKNKWNMLKGNKGIDVLIEIYIEHNDTMGVGDKIALYSANKQIISEVIPEGYEPYSEFRPDEEISALTSPGTIARRMTPSVIPVSAATKVLIELKRKIKEEIRYK